MKDMSDFHNEIDARPTSTIFTGSGNVPSTYPCFIFNLTNLTVLIFYQEVNVIE